MSKVHGRDTRAAPSTRVSTLQAGVPAPRCGRISRLRAEFRHRTHRLYVERLGFGLRPQRQRKEAGECEALDH